jgi:membrane-bound metal-dependent hydrolase YbcI (DUF457 family)
VNREGHAGLSLILFSPIIFLFRSLGADMTNVLVAGLLMTGLSSVPDFDLEWHIKHRGITHTVLFGLAVGIVFAVMLGMYAFGFWGWPMGFIAGFGGTSSHLLGDALTYQKFQPLWPFSDKEVAYGLFAASNRSVNNAMLVLGGIAFILSYEPSIIQQLLSLI